MPHHGKRKDKGKERAEAEDLDETSTQGADRDYKDTEFDTVSEGSSETVTPATYRAARATVESAAPHVRSWEHSMEFPPVHYEYRDPNACRQAGQGCKGLVQYGKLCCENHAYLEGPELFEVDHCGVQGCWDVPSRADQLCCEKHACDADPECTNGRVSGTRYCLEHTCALYESPCSLFSYGTYEIFSAYCRDHKCGLGDCGEQRILGDKSHAESDFCEGHCEGHRDFYESQAATSSQDKQQQGKRKKKKK